MQLKRTDDYENSILVVIILHTGRDTTKCNLSITQMQAGQRDAGCDLGHVVATVSTHIVAAS